MREGLNTAADDSVPAPVGVKGLWGSLSRRPVLVLLLFCSLLWLPGVLSLPPLDRDESRFAQSSRQMLETGDFVDIRLGDAARYKKPVGIYWLQAAATEIFGGSRHDRIWTYRIPSLVGGFLALLIIVRLVLSFSTPDAALAAAMLLGASVLMTAETQIATTDAVQLATIMGAHLALFQLYLAGRDENRALPSRATVRMGWFALALGILIKGPVILGIVGVTVAALCLWDRNGAWLKRARPLEGLGIVALTVLPWLVAIAIRSHGAFFQQSLGHDFADKIAGGQEAHGAPPGYYLALSVLTLFPVTLFVLPALRFGWFTRSTPAIRFLLAWAGASWLLVECVPTKLPHYILPAYPPLAVLAALSLFAPAVPKRSAKLAVISAGMFAIGLLALTLATLVLPDRFGSGYSPAILSCAVAGCIPGLFAAYRMLKGAGSKALLPALLSTAILIPLLTALIAPGLTRLWITPRLAALVQKDRQPGDPPLLIAGYAEPSLLFVFGTDTGIATGAEAAGLSAHRGGLALVEDHDRGAFLSGIASAHASARSVESLSGFNYSRGRNLHFTVYRVVPPAAVTP